jgi:hypothetical protein
MQRCSRAIRLWVASVRVVAGVSTLLVVAATVVLVLIFRDDADRAELSALQRRVSDRLIERSLRKNPLAPNLPEPARIATRERSDASLAQLQRDASQAGVPTSAPADAGAVPGPGELAPSAGSLSAVPPRVSVDAAQAAASPGDRILELLPPSAADTDNAFADSAFGPPGAENPWTRPLPRELRNLRRSVVNGARGGERTALALRAYNQAHPSDARGHLLLGQLYLNRFWRPDAVAQFAIALHIDLAARGAPELLPALLSLVSQGKVTNQAGQLIIKTFGSEALPAIDAALAAAEDAEAAQRLRALRARLGSSRP